MLGRPAISRYRTSPVDTDRLPPGIPHIVGNEAAERFSFYGMKAILAVFMTKHLLTAAGQPDLMSEAEATSWVHNFVAGVYFFPIVGAVLADAVFGKYPVIIALSLVYCVGHGVLALMDVPQLVGMEPRTLLAIGLGLIAFGSGGIKPCVTAHVGDQFGSRNEHLIERIFSWFYFSINLGAAVSTLLTPWLLEHYGPGWAFGVPGILMALATLVFWMGRTRFAHISPAGAAAFSDSFKGENLRVLLKLAPLFVFMIAFWALFDQTASRWVLQADKMDRTVPILGEVLPSQIQAANPLMVMGLIPLMTYVIYPFVALFTAVTPLRKIGFGMCLTTVAYLLPGWIEGRIQDGATPSIGWQVLAYLVLTTSEVLVSITGLEFTYTQAPRKLKSLLMGMFFLAITAGNLLVGQVNEWIAAQGDQMTLLAGANYYYFFAAIMAAATLAFIVWSQFYVYETRLQDEDA